MMSNMAKLVRGLVLLLVGTVISLIIGWWLAQLLREEEDAEPAVRVSPPMPAEINIPLPLSVEETVVTGASSEIAAASEKAVSSSGPDDLTRIDGIGPKYAAGLNAVGIATYGQLAQEDPDLLAEKLKAQGVRVVGDSIRAKDWIGQASRLATANG